MEGHRLLLDRDHALDDLVRVRVRVRVRGRGRGRGRGRSRIRVRVRVRSSLAMTTPMEPVMVPGCATMLSAA